MVAPALRLAMVAGEASGDLLGSLLLRGLQARWPGSQAVGIGGPRLGALGFESWWPMERLSVFGYVDALRRLPQLWLMRRRLGTRLLKAAPAVFVGVDVPDFNFGLETRLRAAGVKTVHFVCPSIWAWRGERVQALARAADHVLCLFPFEPELLAQHGVSASYVGHPLADLVPMQPPRDAARQALGLAAEAEVVALLPGSRQREIEHIGPRVAAAAVLMRQRRPGLQFVLPVAPGLRAQVEAALVAHAGGLPVQLVEGQSHQVLAACDVTLIASGTATLEAALYKRPMVITYRLGRLDWQRMQRMAYQPWFGLPNILHREFVVPELIQDAATPEALASETLAWLDDAPRVQRLQQQFTLLHQQLRRDTAQLATDAIAQVLQA